MPKKAPLVFRGFCPCFWEVDHPLCDVLKQKTQILIAHQKEGIDLTKISTARVKRISYMFFAVDHPLCDV